MPLASTMPRMEQAILVILGALCLWASGWAMVKLTPREGRPPSPWTSTDTRATSVAMGVLLLLVTGIVLVLKGIL
jgi:hypothetical protein